MNFRLATMDDLPQLKKVYKKIIENMNKNNIYIWDEIYPCELFRDDIENNCLYVLTENNEIASAFVLCDSNVGSDSVQWESKHDEALYMSRFGVNVDYLKRGVGKRMINLATELARDKGVKYLRLFVADINEPATNFYIKNGFQKVEGVYNEIFDDGFVLRGFGFEIKTSTNED